LAAPTLIELRTPRLLLRGWRDEDADRYAVLNADRAVMEHFPSVLSREESDASMERIRAGFAERGWGFWVVEIPGETEFAGVLGLSAPRFAAHFTPCVEIGWRLDPRFWGKGYATEGARESMRFGFETLQLDEIVSMTVPGNVRSRAVMERLGMSRDPKEDFDHPLLLSGHPLQRHVLYRIQRGAPVGRRDTFSG
jgi:RimJ/RimL family protein N-acetyltransferase